MAATQATFEELKHAGLDEIDPDIAALLTKELERQRGQIELRGGEPVILRQAVRPALR
ncbi:MAG TPA: hypothetical protein VGH79_04860 [Gaiellaceae bacterium]|jgi:hypothetical protein